mmetsp:Transcript_65345/g.188239  ORF Transcript_65345/g.188239 Transcript_65345/m.188239 type:complete len:694 (+) Transcript_65345:1-2082(+)
MAIVKCGRCASVAAAIALSCLPVPAAAVVASAYSEAKAQAEAYPGCFFADSRFDPLLPDGRRTAVDLSACQTLCAADSNCSAFTYWPESHECGFSGAAASRKPSTDPTVAGYGSCRGTHGVGSEECTSAAPKNGFPGLTPQASNAAWSTGRQPRSLECWPVDFAGNYRSCDTRSVLEDTATGWPGKCFGLIKQDGVLGVDSCRQLCEQDPQCPGWQVGYFDWCYHGVGRDCFVRSNFTPAAAQRIQHGNVRKLMDLAGWHIVGLTRQFVDNKGYFQDQADAIAACRKMCYSSIHCQYWQYTPKYGCWIEDWMQGFGPPYPLTLDAAYRSTDFALDCVAGELIAHICPSEHAQHTVQVSCEARGMKYIPAADGWSDDRVAQSPAECQRECAQVAHCAYFMFSGRGLCRLFDEKATRATAEGRDIFSGPRVCADGANGAHFASGDVGVLQTSVGAKPEGKEEPDDSGGSRQYFVKFSYLVENLEYINLGPHHLHNMREKYAEALAEELGVHSNAVMRTPSGPTRSVDLGDGPGDSTTIVAYVMNTPPTSWDTSKYEEVAEMPETVQRLEATTAHCIHVGNIAVTGLVTVKAIPAVRVSRPVPPLEATGWARWWPFFLLLVLLCIAITAIATSVDLCRGTARDVDLGDSDIEPVGFAGAGAHSNRRTGGSAGSKLRNFGKAVRSHLPGHRRGEFTV